MDGFHTSEGSAERHSNTTLHWQWKEINISMCGKKEDTGLKYFEENCRTFYTTILHYTDRERNLKHVWKQRCRLPHFWENCINLTERQHMTPTLNATLITMCVTKRDGVPIPLRELQNVRDNNSILHWLWMEHKITVWKQRRWRDPTPLGELQKIWKGNDTLPSQGLELKISMSGNNEDGGPPYISDRIANKKLTQQENIILTQNGT